MDAAASLFLPTFIPGYVNTRISTPGRSRAQVRILTPADTKQPHVMAQGCGEERGVRRLAAVRIAAVDDDLARDTPGRRTEVRASVGATLLLSIVKRPVQRVETQKGLSLTAVWSRPSVSSKQSDPSPDGEFLFLFFFNTSLQAPSS